MENSESKETHMAASDIIVGGIPYEMWIFNRASEGIKETVLLCPGESTEKKKNEHNTKQQGITRGCLIKVKLKRW